MDIQFILSELETELKKLFLTQKPSSLYHPCDYIISLGGKRFRPLLTLLTAELFGVSYQKAIKAALSVEVFHNFSLVHDDILDEAPLRRGKETVHKKWNTNTAILAGDVMLVEAFELLNGYPPEILQKLMKSFTKMAKIVCEGQQLDMDFQTIDDISEEQYLEMISFKTAELIGTSMEMGGIIAQQSPETCEKLFEIGKKFGIAFQIQDDWLDAFGDLESVGKRQGGDIISGKRTLIFVHALKSLEGEDKSFFENEYLNKLKSGFSSKEEEDEMISNVLNIYINNKYQDYAFNYFNELFISAYHDLNSMDSVDGNIFQHLNAIFQGLQQRKG